MLKRHLYRFLSLLLIDTATAGFASPEGPYKMTLKGSVHGKGAVEITVAGVVYNEGVAAAMGWEEGVAAVHGVTLNTTAREWALIFDVAKLLGLRYCIPART